jgi:uncharacterized protein with von Willebrand factor type A (vWA) domain
MVTGTETKSQGSLLIAVDGSGSMELGNPQRITMARALALGLAQASKINAQRYEMFTFGVEKDSTLPNGDLKFKVTSDSSFTELAAWSNVIPGSGTSFDFALTKAMSEVEKMGEDAPSTDIVFITDGDCKISPETAEAYRAMKEKLGTRLIYLFVGDCTGTDLDNLANVRLDLRDGDDFEAAAKKLVDALR